MINMSGNLGKINRDLYAYKFVNLNTKDILQLHMKSL